MQRPKNAAGANRTIGRKRPRRRGQNRADCVATAVSARNATIGRNANRAILGPSKSKSARSTRSRAHSDKRIDVYRTAHHCAMVNAILGSRVSTVEKHERSFALFAGVRGLAPRFADVARALIDSARGPTSLRKVNQTPAPSAAIHRRSTSLSQMSRNRVHTGQVANKETFLCKESRVELAEPFAGA